MNNRDETIREKLLDRLTTLGVDARNLAVEVEHGMVIARGSVPNEEQRQRAIDALIGAHELQIAVRPVAPSDATTGGAARRSPARRPNQRTRAGARPIRLEPASRVTA